MSESRVQRVFTERPLDRKGRRPRFARDGMKRLTTSSAAQILVATMNTPTVEQAKQFLKNRIEHEAVRRRVVLSVAEVALLTCSEPNATDEERWYADDVDEKIGSEKYETKITMLIRQAYKQDLSEGQNREWDDAMRALRGEDLYVLVMASEAGVKGANTGPSRYVDLLTVDVLSLAALGCAGCLFFFTPLGKVLKSDALRAVFFVVWLAALWLVGEWSKSRFVLNSDQSKTRSDTQ